MKCDVWKPCSEQHWHFSFEDFWAICLCTGKIIYCVTDQPSISQSQRSILNFKFSAVMGMNLRKVTLLGSNLESVTDLKRIETSHSLCRGYKTFTTRWSCGRVQVWVQVWAAAGHHAISLKAVPEGNQRFRGQNQLPSSWGCSPALLALVRQTDKGHFQLPSLWQSMLASACSLEENTLLLLWYWLSSRVNKVLMLCKNKNGLQNITFFFHVKWKFWWNWLEVVAYQSRPITTHCLVIGLWVEIWHRNKTICSKSNSVQSSRSKLTICPMQRRLLSFKLNSTVTSDGDAQKLGNYVRRDSESIATKVCSQICSKWNAIFGSHVVSSVDKTSFDF